MIKIINGEEERSCLFCKRKEIETRNMSFIDKNGKIVVSMSACYECLKQMRGELERKLEETENEIRQYREIGTVDKLREKQQERKVANIKYLRDFNDNLYDLKGDCPNCGKTIFLSTDTSYCSNCGQKFDWGNKE